MNPLMLGLFIFLMYLVVRSLHEPRRRRLESQDPERLQAKLDRVTERLRVLERIVTDRDRDLGDRIDRLR